MSQFKLVMPVKLRLFLLIVSLYYACGVLLIVSLLFFMFI